MTAADRSKNSTRKKISDLILQVSKLTKLLTEKSTNPAGSESSERTAVSWHEKCDKLNKFHKKGM